MRVYAESNMVRFGDDVANLFLMAYPKGSLKLVCPDGVQLQITTLSDKPVMPLLPIASILNAAGAVHGASLTATVTALNAILN